MAADNRESVDSNKLMPQDSISRDNTIIVILVIIVTTQHYQQYAKGKRDTEWTNPSASA